MQHVFKALKSVSLVCNMKIKAEFSKLSLSIITEKIKNCAGSIKALKKNDSTNKKSKAIALVNMMYTF